MTENLYGTAKKVGMQSLTLAEEEDVGEEEAEQSERLDPMELSWKSALVWDFLNSLVVFCLTSLKHFRNMHQTTSDLSFFTSTGGRLVGGEGGRGAWGRGGRESLPSFLDICHNSRGQINAKAHPTMRHAVQAHENTPEWLASACTMHSRNPVRPRGTHWCMLSH